MPSDIATSDIVSGLERARDDGWAEDLSEVTPYLNAAITRLRELELERDLAEARLYWLSNTVLMCDYGDNNHPDKLIGWRVHEFIAPIMYGESVNAAISSAMKEKGGG